MSSESMFFNIVLLDVLILLIIFVVYSMRRRRDRKRLEEQNIFLETLINSIPSPVFYKDRDGVYLGCNDAFSEMLGKSRDEVVGLTVYDLASKELADVYKKADEELISLGGVQRYETQVDFADGERHDILFTKSVFRDAEGNVAGLLGIMVDISEHKRAEEQLLNAHHALEDRVRERTAELDKVNKELAREVVERKAAEMDSREKKDFLDTILNSISHGLIVIGADDYRIKLANKAASKGVLCGDTHCYDFLHGENAPCSHEGGACPVQVVKRTREPATVQHSHRDVDGGDCFVEITAYPVFNDKGEVVQVIENIMDITARKEAERATIEAKELAETTSRLMSEFLITVSHELRTPMTSVHGFAKLIDKKFDKHFGPLVEGNPQLEAVVARIRSNLEIIISESERLTELINDHLDLSKLESGRMDWKEENIEPLDLIVRAQAATESLLEDGVVDLELAAEEGLPVISGDPDRLLQVMINLISNAVKFTSEGAITCSVRQSGDEVIFSVKDTGIGIPEDQFEQVFSKFSQLQTKQSGKPAGTGLGLAICRKIVEHHGGEIWVESVLDEGSTFRFSLPID